MASSKAVLDTVADLLEVQEDENCEFKEAKHDYDFQKLVKYCCALANEGGGRVVMGVTDRRPRRVVGTAAFPQIEVIRTRLCQQLPLLIRIHEHHHPDGRVLVFEIPGRPIGVPIQHEGRFWARQAESLVAMPQERLREIFAESGRDFSAEICPSARMSDLDESAIADFRRRWVTKGRNNQHAELATRLETASNEQLLRDAEAITDDGITYASLILFGTRAALRKHLPQAEFVFEYRSSEAAGPAAERIEFQSGFFCYYDELWNAVNRRNDIQHYQDGLFIIDVPTFGDRPIREAVLNAVSHRDYQLAGSVFLRQYSRRLEIDSPGGLPWGITLENILDRQNPRNRRIADIFTKCGLVERSGQGMNLIFEESIRHSKPIPDFARTDRYQIGMTIFGTVRDPKFLQFLDQVGAETTMLFGTREWLLLDSIARNERIPKSDDIPLNRLLDLGVIERVGGRRFLFSQKFYKLTGDAAAYTRKKGLDREQNLQLLLNHITLNADTGAPLDELSQVLPALEKSQVQWLLRTLKRRGLAHPIGKAIAAKWLPGTSPQSSDDSIE